MTRPSAAFQFSAAVPTCETARKEGGRPALPHLLWTTKRFTKGTRITNALVYMEKSVAFPKVAGLGT
jgi:hypothetical protein